MRNNEYLCTSITFSTFIEELILNQSARTTMSVIPNGERDSHFFNLPAFLSAAFFTALGENNTLTCLHIYFQDTKLTKNALFLEPLIASLQKNITLTEFNYDYQNFPDEANQIISEIIERNRNAALNRKVITRQIDLSSIFYRREDGSEISAANLTLENKKKLAFKAIEEGNINVLYSLVKDNKELLHQVDSLNYSLLYTAAHYAQIDCVKMLIALGVDVNFNPINDRGVETGSPLNAAVKNDIFVIVKLLLQAGAKTSAKHNGFPVIHDVKSLKVAQILVEYDADVFALCGNETQSFLCAGNTILHTLLRGRSPSPAVVKFFIDKDINVNAQNNNGDTPLHYAVSNIFQNENDLLTRINVLIAAGANPLIKNKCNHTPYDVAELIDNKGFKCRVIRKVTQDYLKLKTSAQLLAQGKRSPKSLFFFLPSELLEKIAVDTSINNSIEEKGKKFIANQFLFSPKMVP